MINYHTHQSSLKLCKVDTENHTSYVTYAWSLLMHRETLRKFMSHMKLSKNIRGDSLVMVSRSSF